jgi:hypothetical protein
VVTLPLTNDMHIFGERARDGWHRGGSGEHGCEDESRGWPRLETTALVDP